MNDRLINIIQLASKQNQIKKEIAKYLPDNLASKYPNLYSELKEDGSLIPAGTRIRYDNRVLRAAVDLWDRSENNPTNAPSLWNVLDFYKGYRIIPEVITASLAFSNGEIGYWPSDNKFYKAKRNGVVHTPSAYPDDWEHQPQLS